MYKKKLFLAICLAILWGETVAQNLKGVLKEEYSMYVDTDGNIKIPAGTEGEILYIEDSNLGLYIGGVLIEVKKKKVDFTYKPVDYFQKIWLEQIAPKAWKKNELRYEERQKLFEVSAEYFQELDNLYGFVNDPFLEDYLNQLLQEIIPSGMPKHRPGSIRIDLLKFTDPVVFASDDGSIILSTGLLSLCRNEEELKSMIAKGISVVILDHNLKNIIKEGRARRFSEIAGKIAGTFSAINNLNRGRGLLYSYAEGTLVSRITSSLADGIIKGLGAKFELAQERESDRMALKHVKYSNYNNPNCLLTILMRCRDYFRETNQYEKISSAGAYEHLNERLQTIKEENTFEDIQDSSYDLEISEILRLNARLEFFNHNFAYAESLIDRNLTGKAPNSEDYYLKALLMRYQNNSQESNQKAIEHLQKAIQINVDIPSAVYAELGLVYFRQREYALAVEALTQYKDLLQKLDGTGIQKELKWVENQIYKIGRFLEG